MNSYEERKNTGTAVTLPGQVSHPRFLNDYRSHLVFQLKPKQSAEPKLTRHEELIHKGMKQLLPFQALFKKYISGGLLENFAFILGMTQGKSLLNSIVSPLMQIATHPSYKDHSRISASLSHEIGKTLERKDDFTAILQANARVNFVKGRQSELEGLAGELKAFQQLISKNGKVQGLGDQLKFGGGVQEVDITVNIGGQLYYVEVAATPDKLRSKLSEGGDPDSQVSKYKALSEENGIPVAYSCPVLKIENISAELIERIRGLNISLIINGEVYTADELAQIKQRGRLQANTAASGYQTENKKSETRKASASNPGGILRDYQNGAYEPEAFE